MTKFAPEIEAAISQAVRETGIPEARLRALIQIESGGRANAQTGSYLGALQLSQQEFRKHGGTGNIFDPVANIVTGSRKLQAEAAALERELGRPPTTGELYMVHQQGEGGAAAHRARPDAPAWQNMHSTGEGQAKGADWAKRAIWGNVPSDVRAQFPGGVDSLTSRQFVDLWNQKVARFGGEGSAPAPQQQPRTPELAMLNAQDGPGTNPTQVPASPMVTSAPRPASGGGLGDDTASAALNAASAYFQDTAARQKEQEAESARQLKLAQAARPDAPGPSPMLAAPRLPNVDIRQLLNVLKARGVATDGTPQTLGSGARSILGT